MVKFLTLSIIAFWMTNPLFAQEDKTLIERTFSPREIKALKRAGIQKGNISFSVIDLETGEVADSWNSNKLNILASVTKMFTGWYALDRLGTDFKFETRLAYDGTLVGDKIVGDLVLIGTGDPLMDSNDMFDLAMTLKDKGIVNVEGNIVVDDSYFFSKEEVSNLGLGDQTYNPSVGPVAMNFNRFTVWRAGKSNLTKKEEFHPIPILPHMELVKDDRTFPKAKRYDFNFIKNDKESWALNLNERYRKTEDVPVRRPALFAGHLLRYYLRQLGIVVTGDVKKAKAKPGITTLRTKESNKLKEIVKLMLEYSNNLVAENVLLRSVRPDDGKIITLRDASQQMQKALLKNPGSASGIEIINGSGLTSENKASASFLSHWLYEVHNERFSDGSYFWPLLSLGGHNGWIRDRFMDPDTAHKVWGKTGSLDYVNNIAGYFLGKSGRWFAYSIFAYDEDKRKILDESTSDKIVSLKKIAPRWKDRTSHFIETMIRGWQNKY